jgi:hypothetical protein
MSASGWIGVDLDGTLAKYDGWKDGAIGEPVGEMLFRVRKWLSDGVRVKCFTARASVPEESAKVRAWLDSHGLEAVEVTNVKDFAMIELWDDRAVAVEPNTGRVLGGGRS